LKCGLSSLAGRPPAGREPTSVPLFRPFLLHRRRLSWPPSATRPKIGRNSGRAISLNSPGLYSAAAVFGRISVAGDQETPRSGRHRSGAFQQVRGYFRWFPETPKVARQACKVGVAGSNPVVRSSKSAGQGPFPGPCPRPGRGSRLAVGRISVAGDRGRSRLGRGTPERFVEALGHGLAGFREAVPVAVGGHPDAGVSGTPPRPPSLRVERYGRYPAASRTRPGPAFRALAFWRSSVPPGGTEERRFGAAQGNVHSGVPEFRAPELRNASWDPSGNA
jgi:hypothetical protein